MSEGSVYYSYLLRLWQVHTNGQYTWRILLEDVQTGEKHGFPDLNELSGYLKMLTTDANEKPGEENQIEVLD